ncbi:MAG TPA: iron-sulfur cluster assembly accessory protein [Urbifossiella sp.]|nr:iron-sulfur cluster assembly accessory protein [Urbifossiella sp.]
MATATANEPRTETCGLGVKDAAPAAPPIVVTPRAAEEVRRHVEHERANGNIEANANLYLRVRVQGGGCSGFQNKLDLDPKYDEKTDHKFEFHGIEVIVDKRSMLYLSGAVVDFHDDLNKRGFTVTNPQAKGTCGCGSSYTM